MNVSNQELSFESSLLLSFQFREYLFLMGKHAQNYKAIHVPTAKDTTTIALKTMTMANVFGSRK